MAASGPSKSASAQERREAQREALRKQRQAELKRQRTVRTIVIAVITVIVLAVVSVAGLFIYRSLQPEGPVTMPEGMEQDQPYLELGAPADSDAPVVQIHLDFMCPHCGTFEEINAARSEEHTSELQSRGHLVCRLLLEKKNTRHRHN